MKWILIFLSGFVFCSARWFSKVVLLFFVSTFLHTLTSANNLTTKYANVDQSVSTCPRWYRPISDFCLPTAFWFVSDRSSLPIGAIWTKLDRNEEGRPCWHIRLSLNLRASNNYSWFYFILFTIWLVFLLFYYLYRSISRTTGSEPCFYFFISWIIKSMINSVGKDDILFRR